MSDNVELFWKGKPEGHLWVRTAVDKSSGQPYKIMYFKSPKDLDALHNLEGPALLFRGRVHDKWVKQYFVDGLSHPEDEWRAHPRVKRHNLLKKINEIQDRV